MALATGDFGLKLAFFIGFAVVFGLVVLMPWTIDLIYADRRVPNGAVGDESAPRGMPGLSRTSMALAVTVVIGFGLLYMLVLQPYGSDQKLVGEIIVALTTTLAAIVAFYFGTRAAQETGTASAPPSAAQPVAAGANGGGPAENVAPAVVAVGGPQNPPAAE